MDIKKIIGIAAIAYFAWTRLKKRLENVEAKANQTERNLADYLDDQQQENISPAEKYLKITPKVKFSEITNNEWTGRFEWEIKNTSPDITFNITRIKSNCIICGYTSVFVPGNRETIVRVTPGRTVYIYSTWQDREWYIKSNTAAKDKIREVLRADKDKWLPVLESDIKIWCRGTGQVEETEYVYPRVKGYALLTKGVKEYWTNEGENAAKWDD